MTDINQVKSIHYKLKASLCLYILIVNIVIVVIIIIVIIIIVIVIVVIVIIVIVRIIWLGQRKDRVAGLDKVLTVSGHANVAAVTKPRVPRVLTVNKRHNSLNTNCKKSMISSLVISLTQANISHEFSCQCRSRPGAQRDWACALYHGRHNPHHDKSL